MRTARLALRPLAPLRPHVLRAAVWSLVTVAPRLPGWLRPNGTSLLESLTPESRPMLRRDGWRPDPGLLAAAPMRLARLPLGARGWLVTGYDEVRQVLADTDTFSNDFGHLVGRPGLGSELDPGGLGQRDPPYHSELRRLLAPEFTARRLASRRPWLEAIVADQLEELGRAADAAGRVDLVAHFARPVPWRVICDLLGLEQADRDALLAQAGDRFDMTAGVMAPLASVSDWSQQLRTIVARSRSAPRPGLLGDLTTRAAHLDDEELAGLVDGLIIGGLETTTSMIALGALTLLQEPGARERFLDGTVPVRAQVDELLRVLSVVQVAFPRFARNTCVVGETTVHRDDVLICSLSAANHDVRGQDAPHLAFGHGVHRCLGAELARLELECALTALLARHPGLRLAVPDHDLAFPDQSVVFGLRELPVLLGAGA